MVGLDCCSQGLRPECGSRQQGLTEALRDIVACGQTTDLRSRAQSRLQPRSLQGWTAVIDLERLHGCINSAEACNADISITQAKRGEIQAPSLCGLGVAVLDCLPALPL